MALAKVVIIIFGTFILLVGFIMLFKPEMARSILRKAGSTNFINYSEITIRMFPAIAMIAYADLAKYPKPFSIVGWIMFITSVILYFVPRTMHHGFSMHSAEILKPIYFQFISPLAFLLGGLIIYNAL